MDRPFEKAVAVRVMHPYVLDVTFNDGHRRRVDIEPLLWGDVFAPLRDPDLFAQAAVDVEGGSVYWPTGADLAPEFLYYGENTPYGPIEIASPANAVSTASEARSEAAGTTNASPPRSERESTPGRTRAPAGRR